MVTLCQITKILTKLTSAQHPHLSYFFKHFLPDLKYKCSKTINITLKSTPAASNIKALMKFKIPILLLRLSFLSFLAWQAPDNQNASSLSISPEIKKNIYTNRPWYKQKINISEGIYSNKTATDKGKLAKKTIKGDGVFVNKTTVFEGLFNQKVAAR